MNRAGTGAENEPGKHQHRGETKAFHASMLAGSRNSPVAEREDRLALRRGQPEGDGRPDAGFAPNRPGAARHFGPLAHGEQPEVSRT